MITLIVTAAVLIGGAAIAALLLVLYQRIAIDSIDKINYRLATKVSDLEAEVWALQTMMEEVGKPVVKKRQSKTTKTTKTKKAV